MSSVDELYASRLSGVRGQHGAQGLTSTWKVVVDDVNDDPVTVLNLASGGVVLGSVYPWLESFGVIAIGFSVRDRWAPLTWLIDVLYGVPLVFPAPTGALQTWQWEGGGALEDEEYEEDAQDEPQLVGIPNYTTKLLAGESFTHYSTKTTDGGCERVNLKLGNCPPRVTPGVRRKRVGWLRATKVVQQVHANQLSLGYQSVSRVNSSTFFGAGGNEVMVAGFGFRPSQDAVSITSNVTSWEINFDFSINNAKWTDVRKDTFLSDGVESFIIDNATGKAVTREYFPYGKVDIVAVMAGF